MEYKNKLHARVEKGPFTGQPIPDVLWIVGPTVDGTRLSIPLKCNEVIGVEKIVAQINEMIEVYTEKIKKECEEK